VPKNSYSENLEHNHKLHTVKPRTGKVDIHPGGSNKRGLWKLCSRKQGVDID